MFFLHHSIRCSHRNTKPNTHTGHIDCSLQMYIFYKICEDLRFLPFLEILPTIKKWGVRFLFERFNLIPVALKPATMLHSVPLTKVNECSASSRGSESRMDPGHTHLCSWWSRCLGWRSSPAQWWRPCPWRWGGRGTYGVSGPPLWCPPHCDLSRADSGNAACTYKHTRRCTRTHVQSVNTHTHAHTHTHKHIVTEAWHHLSKQWVGSGFVWFLQSLTWSCLLCLIVLLYKSDFSLLLFDYFESFGNSTQPFSSCQ